LNDRNAERLEDQDSVKIFPFLSDSSKTNSTLADFQGLPYDVLSCNVAWRLEFVVALCQALYFIWLERRSQEEVSPLNFQRDATTRKHDGCAVLFYK
jgi:hypothetical protein